jgi:hypothetical protein
MVFVNDFFDNIEMFQAIFWPIAGVAVFQARALAAKGVK